jgi:anthranilate phosphoribosyltransferase
MTPIPFAEHLRTIGKGPNMSRPLSQDEARDAAEQIFSGRATPTQIGAFLLLLRYRGESAEEIAGLIEGARATFVGTVPDFTPDVDWPSYADRHRQQPWFILSALLLAENGITVLMHGVKGAPHPHAPNRPVLHLLGIPVSESLEDAATRMGQTGFAYIGTETFCPVVEELCDIRDQLGVRTVINTLARALNPLGAPNQMIGVAHPPYMNAHADVASLLGQRRSMILKGGGGEAQRNPLKPCRIAVVDGTHMDEEDWPAFVPEKGVNWKNEDLDPILVADLWAGEHKNPAAEAAVIATAATTLKQTGKAGTVEEADAMATDMWRGRHI